MADTLILCYHALSERWPAPLSVTPNRFEEQIRILARRGYRGVTFFDAATSPSTDRRVAVTFDDSYKSVRELARPILDRHEMPATVFVPTAFADRDEPMAWPGVDHWLETDHRDELLPMTWQELRELTTAGWEVGSHTRSHPHLTRLDDTSLELELERSRAECEAALGLPCRSLAYPYGDHDGRVVQAARDAGYSAAGTLPSQIPARSTPHDRPRIGIYHRDDHRRFSLKVSPPVRWVRGTRAWTALKAATRSPRGRSTRGEHSDVADLD